MFDEIANSDEVNPGTNMFGFELNNLLVFRWFLVCLRQSRCSTSHAFLCGAFGMGVYICLHGFTLEYTGSAWTLSRTVPSESAWSCKRDQKISKKFTILYCLFLGPKARYWGPSPPSWVSWAWSARYAAWTKISAPSGYGLLLHPWWYCWMPQTWLNHIKPANYNKIIEAFITRLYKTVMIVMFCEGLCLFLPNIWPQSSVFLSWSLTRGILSHRTGRRHPKKSRYTGNHCPLWTQTPSLFLAPFHCAGQTSLIMISNFAVICWP